MLLRKISMRVMALVLLIGVPFTETISVSAATNDKTAQSIVMNSAESRTGKIVRVYIYS